MLIPFIINIRIFTFIKTSYSFFHFRMESPVLTYSLSSNYPNVPCSFPRLISPSQLISHSVAAPVKSGRPVTRKFASWLRRPENLLYHSLTDILINCISVLVLNIWIFLFITLISFTIFICDIFFFLPVVTPLIIIVLSLSYVEDSRQQFHLVRNNLALKCPRSFSCSKHTDEQP